MSLHSLFFKNRPRSLVGKASNIALGFLFMLLWCVLIQKLVEYVGLAQFKPAQWFFDPKPPALQHEIFYPCILAPIWEEIAFRHAPIQIAKGFGKKFVLPVVIIASALFGWGHNQGPNSIMMQGVMGFIFSWVYVKNRYSLTSSILTHSLWNTFLRFIIPMFT